MSPPAIGPLLPGARRHCSYRERPWTSRSTSSSSSTDQVAHLLRKRGYGATVLNGDGLAGEVRVTFSIVPRKEVWAVTRLIHEANPEAYVTVDQTSTVDLVANHGGDVQK